MAGRTRSVDDLYLVPEARGRGIGGRVLDRLEQEAARSA
ncbi:MAG: GNAT family N-acetyltransferase [Geminicoccaceae bacterium]